MGTTITLALLTWFATSYMEWRMGRQSEIVHRILVNPFFGIAFSVFLGSITFSVAGSGVGVGVVIGNLLGLATNELTYNLFTALARVWHAALGIGDSLKVIFHSIKTLLKVIFFPFIAVNKMLNKAGV